MYIWQQYMIILLLCTLVRHVYRKDHPYIMITLYACTQLNLDILMKEVQINEIALFVSIVGTIVFLSHKRSTK